jgi:hypothetical protein
MSGEIREFGIRWFNPFPKDRTTQGENHGNQEEETCEEGACEEGAREEDTREEVWPEEAD